VEESQLGGHLTGSVEEIEDPCGGCMNCQEIDSDECGGVIRGLIYAFLPAVAVWAVIFWVAYRVWEAILQ
jgi:hypothetical protein